jgi:hypothetical protein
MPSMHRATSGVIPALLLVAVAGCSLDKPPSPFVSSSRSPSPGLAVPKPVAFGTSVSLNGEKVQVGKIYCNTLTSENLKNENKQFNSCRKSRLDDSYGDPTTATKGEEFFVVAFHWKNVSTRPIEATAFGTLITRAGTEYALDEKQSTILTSAARGNADADMSGTINPGNSHRVLLAYTIPKGTKVKAVHWGAEKHTEGPPAYALAVR